MQILNADLITALNWRPGPLNQKTIPKNHPKTTLSETFVNHTIFTDRFSGPALNNAQTVE